MNWGSIDTLVINLIGLVIALRHAYQTHCCSVRCGHCTCRTCESGNRLPTAVGVMNTKGPLISKRVSMGVSSWFVGQRRGAEN